MRREVMRHNLWMNNFASNDPLVIAGTVYSSRLLTGTGKFKDLDETRLATEAAGLKLLLWRFAG